MNLKKSIVAGIICSSALVSTSVMAELSANLSATSNYVWRGLTQTDDGAAVQGGVDFAAESGFYLGTWASNVDEGFEIDVYGGFAGEANGIGYDIGYLTYNYTDDAFSENFGELYIAGSYEMFSLTYAMGDYEDDDYTYLSLGAEFEIADVASLGLAYGMTEYDSGLEYDDITLALSKSFEGFDVALTFTSEDDNDEDEVFVSISKGFEL